MRADVFVSLLALASSVGKVLGAPLDGESSSNSASVAGPPDLTPNEFKTMSGTYFVKFFSPYCSHCQAFAPKWNAAWESTHATSSLQWAGVNCIENGDLCTEQGIQSWPTLRIYRDGARIYDYGNPGATEEDLEVFAKEFAKRGDAAFEKQYEKATPELLSDVKDVSAKVLPPAEDNNAQGYQTAQGDASSDQSQTVIGSEKVQGSVSSDKSQSDASSSYSNPNLQSVQSLGPSDFGPDSNVGRWFILFVGPSCEECDGLTQKWERHDNYTRDIAGINWGRVDCSEYGPLCRDEGLTSYPSLKVYQDGRKVYDYEGDRDSMSLRTFLKRAAVISDFASFSLTDLDVTAVGFDGKPLPEGAKPNQEPNYLSGPVVSKPQHDGKSKPAIMDVVKYTLSTLGQPIEDDPGLLIFGESPERHHNFRNWGAPDAPPPAYFEEGATVSHSLDTVKELKGNDLEDIVKKNGEPWFVKFYSPKCSHCQALAPVFDEFAGSTKGKLNAGAVNCEINAKLCESEKVEHYPLLRFYRGPAALEEYRGPRTVEGLTEYALKVSKAQIIPIGGPTELSDEIVKNFDRNLTTFVYLYDQSVMAEDWESLSKVAINIAEWGGKLYRSNSDELREQAGINHRGTAFVMVEVLGEPMERIVTWYDFPQSNIPAKIRDSALVSEWAARSRWSQLQVLHPLEQSDFAPYVAVKLVHQNKIPHEDLHVLSHKAMANDFREFYKERQIQDQDRMRIDRLKQHDEALRQSKFTYALDLMRQKLAAPFVADLAFAYIGIDDWKNNYSKYIDTSQHGVGDVVFTDFYHGLYIDKFNLVPIHNDRAVFDDLIELFHRYEARDAKTVFSSIRHFKTKMANVPLAAHRSQKFQPRSSASGGKFFLIDSLLVKIPAGILLIYLVYRTFIRPQFRAFVARRRSDRGGLSFFPKRE